MDLDSRMPLDSRNLLDFVRGLKDRDENDPIIESFMANGIPQVELEDCALMIEVIIQIFMGTIRTNFIKAVKPKSKKANPFKLHIGGQADKGKVVSNNAPDPAALELVL